MVSAHMRESKSEDGGSEGPKASAFWHFSHVTKT